jgi:hypothetical protein
MYYKFFLSGGPNLLATLQDLAKAHILIAPASKNRLYIPESDQIYNTALKTRLIVVGKKDNPKHRKGEESISIDKLYKYLLEYNIYIGKRKADSDVDQPKKRYNRSLSL